MFSSASYKTFAKEGDIDNDGKPDSLDITPNGNKETPNELPLFDYGSLFEDLRKTQEEAISKEQYDKNITDYFTKYRDILVDNYEIANRKLSEVDIENIMKGIVISNFTDTFNEPFITTIERIQIKLNTTSTFITREIINLASTSTEEKLYYLDGTKYVEATVDDLIMPSNHKIKEFYTNIEKQRLGGEKEYEYLPVMRYDTPTLIYLDLLLNKADKKTRDKIESLGGMGLSIDVFGNICVENNGNVMFPVCYNNLLTSKETANSLKPGTILFANTYGVLAEAYFVGGAYEFYINPAEDKYDIHLNSTVAGGAAKEVKNYSPFNILDKTLKGKATNNNGIFIMEKSSDESKLGAYSMENIENRATEFIHVGDNRFSADAKTYFTFEDRVLPAEADFRFCYYGSFATEKYFTPTIAYGDNWDEIITNVFLSSDQLETKLGEGDIFSVKNYPVNVSDGDESTEITFNYLVPTADEFKALTTVPMTPDDYLSVIAALSAFWEFYTGVTLDVAVSSTPITVTGDIYEGGNTLTGEILPLYNYESLTYENLNAKTETSLKLKYPLKFNQLQREEDITGLLPNAKLGLNYKYYISAIYSKQSQIILTGGVSVTDEAAAELKTKDKINQILDSLHALVSDPAVNFFNMAKSMVSLLHVGLSKTNAISYFFSSKDTVVKGKLFQDIIKIYFFAVLVFIVGSLFMLVIKLFSSIEGVFVRELKKLFICATLYILPVVLYLFYLATSDWISTAVYSKTLSYWSAIDSEISVKDMIDEQETKSTGNRDAIYFLKYSDISSAGKLYGSSLTYESITGNGTTRQNKIFMKGKLSLSNNDYVDNVTTFFKEDANEAVSTLEFKTPNLNLYKKSLYFYFYDNFADQYKKYYNDPFANSLSNNQCQMYLNHGKFIQMITNPSYANKDTSGNVQDILGLGRLFYKDASISNNLIEELSDSIWYVKLMRSSYVKTEAIRGDAGFAANHDAYSYPDNKIYGSRVNAPDGTALTTFERRLNDINKRTFRKILELTEIGKLSDETLIRLAAAQAVFEFNKSFSSIAPWGLKLEPTNYATSDIDMDTILRGSVATTLDDMDFQTNIVEYVDKKGTFIATLLMVPLDLVLAVSGFVTYLALLAVFVGALLNFLYSYGFKKSLGTKSYIGLAGCFGALLLLRVVILSLFSFISNGIRLFSGDSMSAFGCIGLLILLIAIFTINVYGCVKITLFMFKNWKDLGAASIALMAGKISGTLSGMFKSEGSKNDIQSEDAIMQSDFAQLNSGETIQEDPVTTAMQPGINQISVADEAEIENSSVEEPDAKVQPTVMENNGTKENLYTDSESSKESGNSVGDTDKTVETENNEAEKRAEVESSDTNQKPDDVYNE